MKKKKVLLGLAIAACATAALSSCRKGNTRTYDDEVKNNEEENKKDILEETKEEYTINFDLNNGSEIVSKKVTKDSLLSPIERPTKAEDERASYEFVGWYLDNNTFNYLFNFDTKINENITLYAKYKENIKSYNVSFVSEGNNLKTEKLKYGSSINKPNDPIKESLNGVSYSFRGWFTSDGVKLTDSTTIKGDVTYYAYFDDSLIQYDVTFKNGDEVVSSDKFNYGDDAKIDFIPEKEATLEYSYEFIGWYTENDELVTDFTVLGNNTYYAKYKEIKNTYEISFINEGNIIKTDTLNYGDSISLPTNPLKQSTDKYSYEFIGWYTEDDELLTDLNVSKNQTYYAKYKETINTYNITFKNGDDVISILDLDYDSNILAPANPIKDNTEEYSYEFLGWYNELNELVTDFGTVSCNQTFYAKFKETINQYQVTFINNGILIKQEVLNYGSLITKPENPESYELNGVTYTFSGWYDDNELLLDSTKVTKNVTYTANYVDKLNSYTVTFMFEDNVIKSELLNYGANIQAPITPIKDGNLEYSYEFIGWYTEDDVKVLDFGTVNSNITYYAKFAKTINSYQITFIVDGKEIKKETLNYGLDIILPEEPKKDSTVEITYEFIGWYNELNELVTDFGKVLGNATYYAKFSETINQYQITFMNEDDILSSVLLNYGTDILAPQNPEKENTLKYTYTFDGWYTESGVKVLDFGKVKGNTTYYAKYIETINQYQITFINGSDIVATYKLNYDSDITKPNDPVKAKTVEYTYEFDGWYDEFDNKVTDFGKVTSNREYFAKFNESVNSYTIKFINDEEELASNTLNYGTDITSPNTPVKDSTAEFTYTFDGWYTESGVKVTDFGKVLGNATYYARFIETINQYTITFMNGEDVVSSNTLNYGSDIIVPSAPLKDSTAKYTYEFDGWYNDSGVKVTEFGKVSGNETYYARFTETINQYDVYFYDSNHELLYTTKTNYGEIPTYLGSELNKESDLLYVYTFDGFDLKEVTSNQVYVATYTKSDRKYTINWTQNGNILRTDNDALYNTSYGIDLEAYEENGIRYVFNKWEEDIDNLNSIITRNAIFDQEKLSYTVTFKNEDGTVLYTKSDYKYGDLISYEGNIPTKESDIQYDYQFIGWDKELTNVTSDIEFIATYEKSLREYEIKFFNEGTLIKSINVKYGLKPIYDGLTPTKEATAEFTYEFIGWDKELSTVSGDESYNALFDSIINKYTITFKNGNDVVLSNTLNYGTDITSPNTPVKDSTAEYTYEFDGWYTESGVKVTDFGKVLGNATYYARFNETVNQYTVTFVNGSDVLSSDLLNYGSDIVTPASPVKENTPEFTYTFAGWYTESGIKVTDFGTVSGNIIYYARFTETVNTYSITFMNGSDVISTSTLNYGADIEVPASPVKANTAEYTYEFDGWYTESGIKVTEFGKVNGNITYYARFNETVNQYTVTFVNGSDVLSSDLLNYGSDIKAPTAPQKASTPEFTYTFDGWYIESGIKVTEFGTVLGNITYYARFTESVNTYSITFMNEDVVVSTTTLNYGADIVTPASPVKASTAEFTYTFDGWYTESGVKVTNFGKVNSNQTYYARFNEVINQYTVTFMNGSDVISTSTLNYGTDIVTPASPVKENTPEFTYTFDGWYTESGIKVTDFGIVSGNITYYARFTETVNTYSITFMNGSDVISTSTLNYGADIVTPASPVKANTPEFTYEFDGWYTESGIKITEFGTVSGNITYYARFTETVNQYRVTFMNGEDVVSSNTLNYGTDIVTPASPVKENTPEFTYTFDGWYTESGIKVTDFGIVSGNITYYARFTETVNQYVVTFMNGSDLISTSTLNYGADITAPTAPVKANTAEYTYEFDGWYTESGIKVTEFGKVSGNATYYARFTETVNQYTITFMNEEDVVSTTTLNYGADVVVPTAPEKASTVVYTYTFDGWYTASGVKVTNFGTVNSNQTYYARFTESVNQYTITFMNEDDLISTSTLNYGADITAPTAPVKANTAEYTYEFDGWYTESGVKVTDFGTVSGNITYYARYTEVKNQYTYKFYDEDGITLLKELKADYGTNIVAPEVSDKEYNLEYYYKFIGFYDALNGGNKVSDFGSLKENITYYARYEQEAKKYLISWRNYDNSVLKTDYDVVYSTTYSGVTPTKNLSDGKTYVFKSWSEIIVNDTITRTATFDEAKEEYTVRFVDEDRTLLNEVTILNGELASYDSNLTKDGYKFVGWYNNGELFDLNTPITSDLTLTATFVEVMRIGFGASYTPWADLITASGSDSSLDASNRYLLNKDITLNNFTFVNNNKNVVLEDKSGYNTQGSTIKVTLTNTSKLVLEAIWASKNSGSVKVLNSNNEVIYETDTLSNGGNASFTINDLASGTYTIKADYSIRITTLYYETVKEYAKVSFVTNMDSNLTPVRVIKGEKLVNIPELTYENHKLVGWYLDPNFNSLFDFNSSINTDIILYAKWVELSVDETVSVNFLSNISNVTFDSITLEKGSSITLPLKDVTGYRFDAWYIDSNYKLEYNGESINSDTTLYGKYIKQWTITYLDKNGNLLDTRVVDNETILAEVSGVIAPYINGELFDCWTYNGADINDSFEITANVTLKAKYKKDTGNVSKVEITRSEGLQESAYLLFNEYENVEEYNLFEVKNGQTYELSYKDFYITKVSGGYRVDVFGLTKGTHQILVAPVISGSDAISLASVATVSVEEYDRSGYAHFNYTEGVGAYNDDGTLKKNAIVLYVTDENKNTVELTYGGVTVKGIGNILNSAGQASQTGLTSNGGKANTNNGIIKLLAQNNIPLVIRFVGVVSNTGLYTKATFDAKKEGLIEGLTVYNSTDNGGTVKDNGHMARIKSGKDITIEGVGDDATIDGFGFHFMCESSASNLGKSFEVRNLKFINTPEDAIGMEGVQDGSKLTASVERCWVHNNEFYCPDIANAAESDKSEGDGSCDFKRGMYFTCSYNYFEGCHKTNLVGSSDTSLQYNLTYHHNYWYMCKARGPLARMANIHMYNNIFYGQTDYAMNTRANAYIFSESNLFYACKNPFRVDGGAIKSLNDSVSSAISSYTSATIVDSYDTAVSSSCAYNGVSYSSFELDNTLFYKNDYYLQKDPTDAKKVIYARCGTAKSSLPVIDEVTMSDISYVNETVSNVTINNLAVNSQTTIAKLSKTIYAFKITESATATITFADNTDSGTGILCNEAGVCLLKASGTVNLTPGIYFIQPYTVQAGDSKTLSKPVFKEIKNITIDLAKHDDTEYQNQLISEFNNLVNNLPTISYNDNSYNKINAAYEKYNQLDNDSKSKVASNYTKLNNAYNTYKSLGEDYVEGLISNLPINITAENADLVYSARTAYNELKSKVSDASISNYNDLLEAESKLESVAVSVFLNKVSAITEVKYDDTTLYLINSAYDAYDELNSNQKQLDDVKAAYIELNNKKSEYDSLALEANTVTVSFVAQGLTISPIKVVKGSTITLPSVSKEGYRVDGFFKQSDFSESSKFIESTIVSTNMTLYVKFVKQYTVTFKNLDGSTLTQVLVDENTAIDSLPTAKYETGYKFKYWSLTLNGSEYTFSDINSNTTLYAVYEKSDTKTIDVIDYDGEKEVLYAEFMAYEGMTDYNAYISDGSGFKLVDKQLIRLYKGTSFNYYRVDVLGLKQGTYSLKIVAVNNDTEISASATTITGINVLAHEREGFGFVNGSSSGAYNDDGTLKSNAKVIYVSNSNKDTITLDGYVGVQNIIIAMKSQKYISYPVCVRFIGNILDPANMPNGDLYLDGVKNITIEGVGTDATLNGFGIVIKNSSNVEIRNLGFMNCNSTEGDDCGLQQANDHVWVHNCDFFYGDAGSDADQAKGDGALDTKKSTYVTHSYNHFFDNGKCNLQGMKSETTENYITYHHNWYDHSDSRHPRIRTCTVHIYNNYFDGNAKYGVGMTMGGSAFVENNYFRSSQSYKPMLTSGQGTDALGEGTFSGETGGIIKAYGNKFDGSNVKFISQNDNATSFDAYVVSSRNEEVPSSVKAVSGGSTYNNFDTNQSLMYSYNVETPDEAKANVIKYAGRLQGGDFKWTFTDADDADYSVNTALKSAIKNYKDNIISILGIGNQGSTSGSNDPIEDTSYEEVIALIDALPNPESVTEADRTNINNAKAKYDSLSSENKAKVTNVSKLNSCIANLPALSSFTINFSNATCGTGSNVTAYDENNILITCTKIAAIDEKGLKFNSKYGFTISNNSTKTYIMTLTVIGNGGNKTFKYNDETITFGTTAETITITLNSNTSIEFITTTGGAYLTKIEVA